MRFFLDNCLAVRHARALNELFSPDHQFAHLQDKFKPDTPDIEWIPELGREGNWVIISGDYRIGKSEHEKAAWHQSGLTAFFLAKGWTNISPPQQHAKLTLAIPDIVECAEKSKPGTGFMVSLKGKIEKVYSP